MKIPQGPLDVLAIGETLVDFISVEECESLRKADTFRRYLGGSPANISAYVARLGGRSAIISKTGIGAFGQFLKAELQRAGVNTEYLVMDHRVHTSVIFISRTSGTPDFEAFRDGDFQLRTREIPEDAIRQARIVHASTFALSHEPSRSAVARAFELARQHGKLISLDPNYSPIIWPDYQEAKAVLRQMLSYADITKPSLDDATRLFGSGGTPEEHIERFHAMGPDVVVLTMGGEGILLSEGGRITHIPARRVKVLDATAAGDSFWAGFLVAMLDGNPLERCALFAREIVERKLATVGPMADAIDREDIYSQITSPEYGD